MDNGHVLASSGGRFLHLFLGLLPDWLEWTLLGVMAAGLLWLAARKLRGAYRT